MSVIVFGSINMDLAAYVPRLPQPGETLFGERFITVPGGKGANQAVAASRLGVSVQMFGRIGLDSFGRDHLNALQTEGIDVSGIFADSEENTGVAIIEVDETGENTIVVISGANMAVDQQDVNRCAAALEGATVLLLQLEVPIDSNLAVARLANQSGVQTILDPAPATALPSELFPLLDVLTPNAVEAAALVGFSIKNQADAFAAADELHSMGTRTVVIKLGRRGACYVSETSRGWVEPFSVKTVDTVAAGDAFNGGLAAALAEGHGLEEALRWASGAGALAVTRAGALSSLPKRAALDQLLQTFN